MAPALYDQKIRPFTHPALSIIVAGEASSHRSDPGIRRVAIDLCWLGARDGKMGGRPKRHHRKRRKKSIYSWTLPTLVAPPKVGLHGVFGSSVPIFCLVSRRGPQLWPIASSGSNTYLINFRPLRSFAIVWSDHDYCVRFTWLV
jgi:hypothetical protein